LSIGEPCEASVYVVPPPRADHLRVVESVQIGLHANIGEGVHGRVGSLRISAV
jgi:hypothetical protein